MDTKSTDQTTTFIFFLTALLGGGNAVAVRFSNVELAPFWGATIRLAASALLFWLILFMWQIALPQKRDTLVLLVTGFFTVGISFGLYYFGFVRLQASLGSVIVALGPLMTLFLAVLHGLESFRWQSLAGGVIALAGISIAARAQLGADIPMLSLVALMTGSAISAEGNVILKTYSPKSDPVATNALTLTTGVLFLALTSFLLGEPHKVPTLPATWIAITYTVLPGTVLMFHLYLWILLRWSASATAYVVMLFPIVATTAASLLIGERITLSFILGGALVLTGVWIGALMKK